VAVINTAEGHVQEVRILSRHPKLVLVDSEVIIHAPTRFLIAGIGDALATWFEARACSHANGINLFGEHPTQAGLALAKACWDNLVSSAKEAVRAASQQKLNQSAEIVIETNILLSGLGFENGGLALAHALHNGLSQLTCTQGALHGEKVAFGLLVQCVAEEANETEEVLTLLQEIGLPTTLEALGCHSNEDSLQTVVNYVFSQEITKIRNEPIEISPRQLFDRILEADSLGHSRE
jgi:glycerol dehydrogenase